MATIAIKDLTESLELDRQAMTAIAGGARLRGRQAPLSPLPQGGRLVDYPAAYRRAAGQPAAGRKAGK